MKLSQLIKQEHFVSPEHEALLNVIVTSNWILGELAAAMAPYDVTPSQYNVLRILRGSHPKALTCSEVGERLLDRTPDVTRLLNRLERNGLVSRERAAHDRRVVEVSITRPGLDLLEKMAPCVAAVERNITRHLSAREHRLLNSLLERLRTDQ